MAANYTIDFETTGLPTGVHRAYDEYGRTVVLNPSRAFLNFGHIDVTQFAIHDGKTNRIKHYSVEFNKQHKMPSNIDRSTKHTRNIPGIGKVDAYTVNTFTERDADELFDSPWSKLKGAKKEWYKRDILPGQLSKSREVILSMPTINGNMFISKSAFEFGVKTGDFKITNGKLDRDFKAISSVLKKKNIHNERITYEQFQDLLKTNVKKFLKQDRVQIGAWNPFYDINLYMSELKKMGANDLANRLYKMYIERAMQPNELEKVYKAFLFQLGKENPELGNMFRIGYNPVAAAATGRPGQIARTFNEIQYVGGYKAERAAEIISKHIGINVEQLHTAGTDVAAELKINKEIEKLIEKAGLSVEGIIRGDRTGNLSEYLKKTNVFEGMVDDLKRQFGPIAESYSKYPSMFEGQRMANGVKAALSKASKIRIGAIGAALGLGLITTYGIGGEGELAPFSDRMKVKDYGSAKSPNYKTFFEDDHNSFSEVGKVIGTMGGLGAFFYGLGAYSKYMSPKNMGSTPNFKDVFGTIYRGIRQIEGAHNITRVFQAGSTIDFYAAEMGFNQKDVVFKTIRNGNIIPRYGTYGSDAYIHGIEYRETLDLLKGKISDDEYKTVSEWLSPTTSKANGRDIVSREIRLSRDPKTGAMVVYKKDFLKGAAEGAEIAENVTLPVRFAVEDIRKTNIDMNTAARRRGAEFGDKYYIDRISYLEAQKIQVRQGDVSKSYDDWMKIQKAPKYVENLGATKAWEFLKKIQYNLELMPKGVGESDNQLYAGSRLLSQRTSKIIRATQIMLPGHELENARLRWRNTVRPIRSLTLERFNNFFESPFEMGFFGLETTKLERVAHKWKNSGNLFVGLAGKGLHFINRPHLGLSMQDMRYGAAEWAFKFGVKRVLPAMVAWEAFRLTDHALGALTMSPTGRGPLTELPIKAWEGTTLLYSKISDITGFTKLTKKQEEIAPGSTRLGIFAPALTATSMYGVGRYLYKNGPISIKNAMNSVGKRLTEFDTVKNALRPEAYSGALNRSTLEKYMSWAIKNPKRAIFSFAMMPMLPFLPGFIGSNKTYQERLAEYKGDKEVAIRKYRGWLLSSSPYEGGKPIQFRKHMFNLVESDYENRGVVWPNYWERLLHNATLGVYKPYILEEYHKESQPVYESAPYGSHIPLLGQPIASTIGKLIKPTRVYNRLESGEGTMVPYEASGTEAALQRANMSAMELARAAGIDSESSANSMMDRWSRQYHDLIGFTGFAYESARKYIAGESPSEFTPFKESAGEMYNPAQQMWGWHLGDITGVGGEFLRRIFPYPMKNWKVNDLRNELYGVSWIPQESEGKEAFKRYNNDVTHGTTFDNTPLGWLYASRKGWEFLYPEVRGMDLEQYPDPVRLEILQSIAPYTSEFRDTSRKVMQQALGNQLSLSDEQRYYETLDQVRQLKDQLYANKEEYAYDVSTERINGTVSEVGNDGTFALEGDNRRYRLAGVSMAEADIRANLIQKRSFSSTEDLARATEEIQSRTRDMINKQLYVGSHISLEAPTADQMNNANRGIEAIVGNLNQNLIENGAAFTNTGNLSEFNMQQDRVGAMGTMMSKYWNMFADDQTFFARKFIPNRDYLANYKQNQVFNREVKIWSRPIEHFIQPAIASTLHQYLGINIIPEFTLERRRNQEYWDVLKYIKYKVLAVQAAKSGNEDEALYYHNMWRSTMIGADPTDDNTRDELAALPANERAYYTRFANEPDPEKRGEIYKYLPRAARRIYSAIWNRKIAESSSDVEQQRLYQNIRESEGWGMTPREYKMYMSETGGNVSKADWIRARYVREFMKKHPMPSADWIGFSPDVDIENVELLALREGGEQIQDYGFFDNKLREAIFDQGANLAAHQLKSVDKPSKSTINQIISYIIQDDRMSAIAAMPTASTNPITNVDIETNGHQDMISRQQNRYASLLDGMFSYNY